VNARQALYDAIKAARDTGEAWVTYRGARLHLRPVSANFVPCGESVLAMCRGRIRLATLYDKDGLRADFENGVIRRLQCSDEYEPFAPDPSDGGCMRWGMCDMSWRDK
jgi:hypothetical protein